MMLKDQHIISSNYTLSAFKNNGNYQSFVTRVCVCVWARACVYVHACMCFIYGSPL